MQFKQGQLVAILGCSKATESAWLDPINSACARFNIDTKLRLAAFIAQVGHESNNLSAVIENLNYSAAGLIKTWPSRFNTANASLYERKPESIANKVYASRMGNGDEASGDGWKYRGRGLIQCTGKSNYDAFSQECGVNAVGNPDSLAQPTNAALSAAWFWGSKGLNAYADRSDFITITKRINGGTIGQAEREALYKKALIVLSDETLPKDEEDLAKAPFPPSKIDTTPITDIKAPVANSSTIGEPRAAYGFGTGKYPWNFVHESRSGHVIEIDDTPGSERLNNSHRTGSYWEIDPVGTFTHKSVLDSYKLTKEDSYVFTGSDHTEQIVGSSFTQVGGTVTHKVAGNFYINTPRVQLNTGILGVTGEIITPRVHTDIMVSPFADTLAKVAMVAWDLGGGSGGDGTGGGAAEGTPVINGSLGMAGTAATEGLRANNFANRTPSGKPVISNGFQDTLTAVSNVGTAVAGVASILKNNDTDEKVANAMNSAAAELDSNAASSTAGLKPEAKTPVFIKHVSFDKPTLLSQSTVLDAPEPKFYHNNLHTTIDADGRGVLCMSDGANWIPVGKEGAKDYVDGRIDDVNNSIAEEQRARVDAIIAEQAARNAAIAAEAMERQQSIRSGLLAEAEARQAAVQAEATIRQTQDESFAQHLLEITASVAGNAAAIQTEQQARVDAISAEASARQTLASVVNDNIAAIQSEVTARTTADSALATRIDSLTSTTGDSLATINSKLTTLTNTDIAQAQRIDALVTKTDTTNAAVTTETTARSTADEALGHRIDAVITSVGDVSSSVVSEVTARATADTALSNRLDALVSTVGDVSAAVITETTARANADNALSQRIESLVVKTNDTNASIVNLQKVVADGDSALATQISNVSAAANSAQDSANTANSSIAAANAVIANITSDNVLSRGEKRDVILSYSVLVGERSMLEGQANTFGITTEKNNYSSAVDRLVSYITGLSPAYDDVSKDTPIVSSTFRTRFSDVYSTKQTLLNAIDAKAKTLADGAQDSANVANNTANAAIANLAAIASDNVLSKGEKSDIILQYTILVGERSALVDQASSFGIDAPKTAYSNAVDALISYITGLSPAYNDIGLDTPIVGTTFRNKFTDVYSTKQSLLNAIDARAKVLADNAQGSANAAQGSANAAQQAADIANAAIGNISSDNVLSKGEKSSVIIEYGVLTNEQATLENQGTAFSITTEKSNYTNAVNALRAYINGLSPAYNSLGEDTPIDGATFRVKFSDVYAAKVALLNAIDNKSKSLADNAQGTADAATNIANNATTSAAKANLAISNITSDNVLSMGEKSSVILQYNALNNEKTILEAQADAFNITTQKSNYTSAIVALTDYLNSLSPAWTDVSQDTPIVGSTMRSKFSDVLYTKQVLVNAIDSRAKFLADNAQSAANVANAAIANISSDNVLAMGEKRAVMLQYNVLVAEQSGLESQGTAFGITTQKTNYSNAINALKTYITGLSPAYDDVNTDTPVDGTTFRQKFLDVYTTRQIMLNLIDSIAKSIADSKAKVTRSSNPPSNPSIGDIWIDISSATDLPISKVWNGSVWQETDYRTAKNSADIVIEQQARADGDSANASLITNLSTSVDGRFSGVQQTMQVQANALGEVKAQYAIKTNVNGHVAGISLINSMVPGGNGATSSFTIQADQFRFVNAGSNVASNPAFYVDGSGNAVFAGQLSVQSSSSGARVVITNSLIQVYDGNNVLRVRLGIW